MLTDDSASYVDNSKYVELHVSEKSSKELTKETLHWMHIAISNAKRNLLGINHKIKGKYLQLYLNEFGYKLNRRFFCKKLFDRLVIARITELWCFKDNLKIKRGCPKSNGQPFFIVDLPKNTDLRGEHDQQSKDTV